MSLPADRHTIHIEQLRKPTTLQPMEKCITLSRMLIW